MSNYRIISEINSGAKIYKELSLSFAHLSWQVNQLQIIKKSSVIGKAITIAANRLNHVSPSVYLIAYFLME
jgi:hypothetical protein